MAGKQEVLPYLPQAVSYGREPHYRYKSATRNSLVVMSCTIALSHFTASFDTHTLTPCVHLCRANKRQLRPIYNLPTRGSTANAPPAAASELAQKELMLQAVQKKYHQVSYLSSCELYVTFDILRTPRRPLVHFHKGSVVDCASTCIPLYKAAAPQ